MSKTWSGGHGLTLLTVTQRNGIKFTCNFAQHADFQVSKHFRFKHSFPQIKMQWSPSPVLPSAPAQ